MASSMSENLSTTSCKYLARALLYCATDSKRCFAWLNLFRSMRVLPGCLATVTWCVLPPPTRFTTVASTTLCESLVTMMRRSPGSYFGISARRPSTFRLPMCTSIALPIFLGSFMTKALKSSASASSSRLAAASVYAVKSSKVALAAGRLSTTLSTSLPLSAKSSYSFLFSNFFPTLYDDQPSSAGISTRTGTSLRIMNGS